MDRVGEHPVPAGPLAPRWLAYELGTPRAGATTAARVVLENAGTATWRSKGNSGIQLAYHWLDSLGNPVVWEGSRSALPHPVGPGQSVELNVRLESPRPPGRYRLAFDLVEEHHFWFEAIGAATLELPVQVAPLIDERSLAVVLHGGPHPATAAALSNQEETVAEGPGVAVAHLVAGAEPAPDWSRRLLDAHEEGWEAVGPALVPGDRRDRKRLSAWAPGGRKPNFEQPLLLPSLLAGLEPVLHDGLPAWTGGTGLFDGRIEVRLRPRSDRRPT